MSKNIFMHLDAILLLTALFALFATYKVEKHKKNQYRKIWCFTLSSLYKSNPAEAIKATKWLAEFPRSPKLTRTECKKQLNSFSNTTGFIPSRYSMDDITLSSVPIPIHHPQGVTTEYLTNRGDSLYITFKNRFALINQNKHPYAFVCPHQHDTIVSIRAEDGQLAGIFKIPDVHPHEFCKHMRYVDLELFLATWLKIKHVIKNEDIEVKTFRTTMPVHREYITSSESRRKGGIV